MKKVFVTSALVTTLALAGVALAQEVPQMRMMPMGEMPMTASSSMMMGSSTMPMGDFRIKVPNPDQVLEVNGRGDVLLRGTVQSSSADAITVKSWGGVWTIKKAPKNSEVISQDSSLSTFAVGDYVGVKGRIVTDATLTIEGSVIRNRSFDDNKFRKMQEQMKKMMNGKDMQKQDDQKRPQGPMGSSTMQMREGDRRDGGHPMPGMGMTPMNTTPSPTLGQ